MQYFNSSAIEKADYDEASMRLFLWFWEGGKYTFCRVPLRIWTGLLAARSQGTYYHEHIRDKYEC